jgi:hypothetical protein
MKKNIAVLTVFFSSITVLSMITPAQAQVDQNTAPPPPLAKSEVGRNTVGPSVSFGSGVAIGIDSKFGIAENLSLRPFIYFGNGGTDFGTALTYDINLKTSNNTNKITPFVGGAVDIKTGSSTGLTTASLVAGAEYELTDTVQLKAAVNVPLNSAQGQNTNVTVGAGFRF